jgi:hypothetical protein
VVVVELRSSREVLMGAFERFWTQIMERIEAAAYTRRRKAIAAVSIATLFLLLVLLIGVIALHPSCEEDSTVSESRAQSEPQAQQQSQTDNPREWLLSSRPEGNSEFFPDWHVILTGSLETGTISIPEEKTATGTYRFDGDTLTIDITRLVGTDPRTSPWPQDFRYEFTGYPADKLEGTVLIGRLNPSEPEWRPPRAAQATR